MNINFNLCRISSDLRTADSISTSQFRQSFNNMQCCSNVNTLFVKSVEFPNTFYNINSSGFNLSNNGNNTFFYTSGGGVPATVVIPPGNYTITSLLAVLIADAGLTALGFNAVLNPVTGKIDFTSTGAIGYFTTPINSMGEVLGIDTPSVGEVLSFSPNSFPDLSGVDRVYVTSQKLTDGSSMVLDDSQQRPVLVSVDLNVPFAGIVSWRALDAELEKIAFPSFKQGKNIREVDVSLRDKYDNPLDLGGASFNMILILYHNSNN
jgi:hypothetical protein